MRQNPWPSAASRRRGHIRAARDHSGGTTGAGFNDNFRECKAVRVVLPLIGAIALAGCVSQQEQQQKNVTAQLDTWIGQSISTVVGAHGQAQATFDLGPNKKMFQWVITSQSPGLVAPISGMAVTRGPQTQDCKVSLTATTSRTTPTLADWTITSYQWAGASC
jgi:hypothetical protein